MNTFILTWNPNADVYKPSDFQHDLQQVIDGDNVHLYRRIIDHKHCNDGDRFFMVRTDQPHAGICMAGYFCSNVFLDEGVHCTTIDPLLMVDTEMFDSITLDDLQKLLPDVDWKNLHSGTMISEKDAGLLEEAWLEYLYKHLLEFEDDSNMNAVMSWDFDIEDFESVPPSLQKLYKKRYGNTCERCGRSENEVDELAYHVVMDEAPVGKSIRQYLRCYCSDCWFGDF